MHTVWFVVTSLCVLGLTIRTGYEVGKLRGRVDLRNRGLFAVVSAAMCTMLLAWPVMCPLDPWRIMLPDVVRWIGRGLVGVALVLALGGLVQLRGVENIDHLVTTGLFSRVRHPMYAGFILWIVGWATTCGALGSLAVGVLCIGNILYWRHLEEDELEARYGERYRGYRLETWF
jgi:protein-S-isoprenylcysteine O-methyltransferase Ste14